MNADAGRALWQQIRDAVADGHVYYLNLPPDDDKEAYIDHIVNEGILTLSDWGLAREADVYFTDDDEIVSPDTVAGDFADPMAGRIDWDRVRDRLHNELFADNDTKVKAGQVTAGIRRFVDEMSEGDFILTRFPSGVTPAVIEGPARYSRSTKSYQLMDTHAFRREVTWGTVNGARIEIPLESLPPGFGPGRQTVGTINDPSPVVALLQGLEWIAEQQ
jgi:hypothetical protein